MKDAAKPTRPEIVLTRPRPDEYATFFREYVDAVGAYDPFALLWAQVDVLRGVAATISEPTALHRYAEGKWSVKETLGHLSDAERVISYSLFRISRGDGTPLRGFDEGSYVNAARFDVRSPAALVDEFECVRETTLRHVASMSPDDWERWGVFEGVPMSARAFAYILPGHVEHHLRILHTRYGVPVPAMERRYGRA